ncbi:PREDICTED: uncharacterized protein LOC106818003 [Priapulus caudatus]|uniref:Uncharacterized protein LOC106818003 n=1 Tax=Priapulus caudatus TaxID=37621 RepID=A0ABM1F182_PRICU|nr:PREDICTED: uncharacterized protein LOC106818003 [Priapulus caudatus]
MIWQLATVAPAKPLDDGLLAYLIVAMVIGLLGLPPVLVCAVSLLSKLTSLEHQGFRQGVQSSVSNIAQTIGPLWGSALVIHLYWLYPVTLLVILLPVVSMTHRETLRPHVTTNSVANCMQRPFVKLRMPLPQSCYYF